MQLRRLTLTQFRAFEQAEFEFQPRMNLLVGVNGVGKSTVLDALRILLSQILPKVTASKSKPLAFSIDDLTIGRESLTAQLDFDLDFGMLSLFALAEPTSGFRYLVHKPRERFVLDESRLGEVREQVIPQLERSELTPDELAIRSEVKTNSRQPIAVYFSTRRSLASMATPSTTKSLGEQASAFAEALAPRELRIVEFADWWRVKKTLAREDSRHVAQMQVLEDAVNRFMEGFSGLEAKRELQRIDARTRKKFYRSSLQLQKNGTLLDVRQLSEGERGLLALVLDLARRLAQANPYLKDPLQEGKGIVLIDELDLHLHPSWQRDIVRKLRATFPSCQFIVTTHSPQIVGEVPPENIILLESGVPPYRPNQSLGMDTNWILKRLMGTEEREAKSEKELKRIARLIENEKYDQATKAIDKLRARLGEFPELVRLQTRIDRIRLLAQ